MGCKTSSTTCAPVRGCVSVYSKRASASWWSGESQAACEPGGIEAIPPVIFRWNQIVSVSAIK